jgi:hypothetical protein
MRVVELHLNKVPSEKNKARRSVSIHNSDIRAAEVCDKVTIHIGRIEKERFIEELALSISASDFLEQIIHHSDEFSVFRY